MKLHFTSLLIFVTGMFFLHAESTAQIINKWQVHDLKFKGPNTDLPFDIHFGAKITAPDGKIINVPGFYNGNREYIVRFTPDLPGKWAWETWSSNRTLQGKTGEVLCIESAGKSRGPIKISKENPEHFYYTDGTPYFLMAFECDWLFALDLDNPVDIPKTKTLVDQIAENGFNHVVMNIYAHDRTWKKDPSHPVEVDYGNPSIFPFGGDNDHPDFSTLNPVFFQRLDRVVAYLNEKNIAAHLMIYVWNKKVNWPAMYSESDNMYFDYIIARYQAYPNLIWDISKEALSYGRCDIPYVVERISRLRRLDAHKRLMTVHDYGFCNAQPELVDFISIQTWLTDLHSFMLNIKDKHQDKPVFNIEHGGYEEGPYYVYPGDYVDPVICLDRNYQCAFAGVYSTYYWQNSSWSIIIHNPANMAPSEKPKFEYFKFMTGLFGRYPFDKLRPASHESSSGYCLKNDAGSYLFYVPKENYAIHPHFKVPDNTIVREIWFNPLTGEYKDEGTNSYSPWKEYRTPWRGISSVLILEIIK